MGDFRLTLDELFEAFKSHRLFVQPGNILFRSHGFELVIDLGDGIGEGPLDVGLPHLLSIFIPAHHEGIKKG